MVQARPWPLAFVSLAVMVVLLTPVFALRLDTSDAGNDPANTSSRQAFDLLAQGLRRRASTGRCCSSPSCPGRDQLAALPALQAAVAPPPTSPP